MVTAHIIFVNSLLQSFKVKNKINPLKQLQSICGNFTWVTFSHGNVIRPEDTLWGHRSQVTLYILTMLLSINAPRFHRLWNVKPSVILVPAEFDSAEVSWNYKHIWKYAEYIFEVIIMWCFCAARIHNKANVMFQCNMTSTVILLTCKQHKTKHALCYALYSKP